MDRARPAVTLLPFPPGLAFLSASGEDADMKIGVIGLGSMGAGAAARLVHAGHDVTGCDTRAGAVQHVVTLGGTAAATPQALPPGLDALIVFVVNAAQVEAVLFGPEGCAGQLAAGTVVLLCATVPPATARDVAARLAASGVLMLDAPVSGGSGAAAAGSMTVMASGSAAAFERAGPVLDAIAAKVWRLGDEAGAGSTVKMVNQLLAGVHIAAAAEAMALGIKAGADPQTLFDVISVSAGSSWMFQNRVPHIFVKDLGIVLDGGRALTIPLPLSAAAHQLFLAVSALGYGQRDDAFVIRFWEALAGVKLPK